MSKYSPAKRKLFWSSVVVLLVASLVLLLLAKGVLTLDMKFGEALATFAMWTTFGALMGQSKKPKLSMGAYLRERGATIVAMVGVLLTFLMFYVVYIRGGVGLSDPTEMLGVMALFVVGLALGFIVGTDRDS